MKTDKVLKEGFAEGSAMSQMVERDVTEVNSKGC